MKKVLISLAFVLGLTGSVFAGTINNIYLGAGYIGNGFTASSSSSPIFDVQIGTGQRIELGKFILLGNEIINVIPYKGVLTGFGAALTGVVGYKLLGGDTAQSGLDIVPFGGVFCEGDLSLVPFTVIMAYGPSFGANVEYWFTPGFGMSFNSYLNINLVYFQGATYMSPVMPSFGISMTFRPDNSVPKEETSSDDGWSKSE